MKLERLHHRLSMGMGLAGVVAAWGGGVLTAPMALLGFVGLSVTLAWRPREPHPWLDRALVAAAVLLAVRAAYFLWVSPDNRLGGMVDVLLLLLVGEAWKAPGRSNDVRLYVLSFALLLAATVYRPGLVFALAFVAYLGFSTVALMVGHLRRKTERYGVRELVVGRRFLLGTSALSLVTLTISVAVFLSFPRVSRGWAQGGPSFASRIAGFADEVSLGAHGATIESNPEIVLRVEFPDGRPDDLTDLHWRGRSYDRFDGVRWGHSERIPRTTPSPDWYDRRWPGRRIRQVIYGSLLDSRVLFALHPAVDIEARNRIRPYEDRTGDLRFFGVLPPDYTVVSVLDGPSPEALRGAPDGRAPGERNYLQLPPLSPRVARLADSLTMGLTTRLDKAHAIEGWLQGLTYTRDLPATAAQASLEYFLFQRRAGHCEYFSTAMAVLLRSLGIPARNVNGFLGGQWNAIGNHLAVTQNEAHSWVEVWFPGYGWVTFDPTPAGGAGEAAGRRAWFWPGRILLDGLQHRWNKWVLDYSLANQRGFFQAATRLLEPSSPNAADPGGRGHHWLVWIAAVMGITALVAIGFRKRSRTPEITRLYLRLRQVYDRYGFDGIPRGAPLRFADAVDGAAVPGRADAASLTRRYVRLRFSGLPAGADDLQAMRGELKAARRALRRA